MNNVKFNQELMGKCYYLFYQTTVYKLTDDKSKYIKSDDNTGNFVEIFRTSWEYEEGKRFYTNEDFENFVRQDIQEQIDYYINDFGYSQEEAEKALLFERLIHTSYRD